MGDVCPGEPPYEPPKELVLWGLPSVERYSWGTVVRVAGPYDFSFVIPYGALRQMERELGPFEAMAGLEVVVRCNNMGVESIWSSTTGEKYRPMRPFAYLTTETPFDLGF